MTTRYAHNDAYTYEDSSVLRNKAGHETQEALDQFERLSVANRLMEDPPEGNFDYAHLKAVHFHLFQDVYDWAGKERTVSISMGTTLFANPRFITKEISRRFKELESEDHLQLLDADDFVERAAHYMVELNMIHPFREGNGRVSRYLLSMLADGAGYGVDMDKLKDGWLAACLAGVSGDEASMRDLIAGALVVFED